MSVSLRPLWRAVFGANTWRSIIIAIWVVSTVLLFIAANNARNSFSNVDAVSYVSIATQYSQGHIAEALNAYWSPMLSWALVPFLWAGGAGVPSIMLINAISASSAAAVGSWFVWHRTRRSFAATIAFMGVALSLGAGTVASTSPDMIAVLWSMVFVVFLVWIDERYDGATFKQRILFGAIVGVIGAIGYFTKLFLLPAFVGIVVVWYIVRLVLSRRELKGAGWRARGFHALIPATAFVAFALVAAPWVISLSVKYETFMAGSSFSVNVAEKFVPEAGVKTVTTEEPSLILESPPNDYAVAYIEDPTVGVAEQQEVAASAKTTLLERADYYLTQRVAAFPYYLQKLGSIAPFAFPSMLLIVLAVVLGYTRYRSHPASSLIALLWSVYFLGYAAIVSVASGGGNHRYYWPLLLLSTMAVVLYWPSVLGKVRTLRFPRIRTVLVFLVLMLLPGSAALQLAFNHPAPFSTVPSSLDVRPYLRGETVKLFDQTMAEHLRDDKVLTGGENVASNDFRKVRMYAFFNGGHAFGRDRPNDITDPAFQAVLAEKDVDLYFYFDPYGAEPVDFTGIGEVVKTYDLVRGCNALLGENSTQTVKCTLDVVRLDK